MKRFCVRVVLLLGMFAVTSSTGIAFAERVRTSDDWRESDRGSDRERDTRESHSGPVRSPRPRVTPPTRTPEPATLLLAGVGCAAALGLARRKKEKKA